MHYNSYTPQQPLETKFPYPVGSLLEVAAGQVVWAFASELDQATNSAKIYVLLNPEQLSSPTFGLSTVNVKAPFLLLDVQYSDTYSYEATLTFLLPCGKVVSTGMSFQKFYHLRLCGKSPTS